MEFIPIDAGNWPRREVFWYFSQKAPTGYSLTVDWDVTVLRRTTRAQGVRFFPAYLWLVTECLNRQPEFKLAVCGGKLGYFDTLTPLYAAFHEDDHTFSLMWTPFSADFAQFYRQYCENDRLYGAHHGILAQPGTPPENAYTVSCVPWVGFRHFAVHSYGDQPYYFPSVEGGRFFERDGRTYMPLSLTCHHAATDGWHVARFLEDLRQAADAFSV